MTLSGNDVVQWNDASGNGYHLGQATESKRPHLVDAPTITNNTIGRKSPAVQFTKAATQFLTGTVLPYLTSSYTMSSVVRMNTGSWPNASQTNCLWINGEVAGSGQSVDIRILSTVLGVLLYHAPPINAMCFNGVAESYEPKSVSVRYGSDVGEVRYGSDVATAAMVTSSIAVGFNTIGARANTSSDAFDGYVHEMSIYNRRLDDAEIAMLSQYYLSRYGTPA